MKKTHVFTALVCVGTLLFARPEVYGQVGVGAHIGYNMDVNEPYAGLNARLDVREIFLPLILTASWDAYLGLIEGVSLDQIDVNGFYVLPLPAPGITTYVGGGVAFWFQEIAFQTSTDTGVNLVGIIHLNLEAPLTPFGQGRLTFFDERSDFSLTAGVFYQF